MSLLIINNLGERNNTYVCVVRTARTLDRKVIKGSNLFSKGLSQECQSSREFQKKWPELYLYNLSLLAF